MKTLQALGWNWRTDGVEVCAQIDGQRYALFVPLNRVWHEFAKSFAEHGVPLPASVGAGLTVSGLFDAISQAQQNQQASVGWFGSSIAHAVSHAASSVAKVALAPVAAVTKPIASAVQAGTRALSSVPVFGGALSAATTALTSPVSAVNALARGGKINTVALNALKQNIASMRTLAPYAQTVISVVPGVGQGLSGAIGAGLALASGMSVSDALMAGVRDSLPGGPLARAAFDVASAAAQGKSISQLALAALPISPAQKAALVQSVQLARDLAAGKNVSQTVMNAGMASLPPDLQKPVQIALALAHAKSLQQAVAGVANASGVANTLQHGIQAALHLQSLPAHMPAPPHLVAAVQRGLQAKQAVAQAANLAAQGHAPAAQWLSFLQRPHISGPLTQQYTARFHTGPAHPQHRGGNRQHRGISARVGAPILKPFTARFHTDPPATVSGGIHARFGSGRPFSYPARPVPQLNPVRMPYQTAPQLHYAWGR